MKAANIFKLITAIVVSEAAGIVGSIFTVRAIPEWYATLAKPSFNPPSWLFGPVWTTLYLLMGISAFLVWKKISERSLARDVKIALAVFGAQLVMNTLWSIVFFGLHSPAWAFVVIIALWVTIVWTMIAFYKISHPAMYLLVPYIAWVSFAGVLNLAIWRLN